MLSAPAVPAQLMEGRGATVTYLWESGWAPFGVLWNSTGQPAASVPAGFDAHGLPLAVQLVGAPARGGHAADPRGDRSKTPGRGNLTARPRSIASVRRRMAGCRICSGELELKVRGNGATVTADGAVAVRARARPPRRPARAAASAGRCSSRSCPQGDQLHDLYRDMRDDAYLTRGGRPARDREPPARPDRRRTSRSGRLLDVGCGHGLLLDEARRRGYDTVGLELSREAAEHAREALGLDVRELPLEGFSEGTNGDSPGGFDVVVLADVLEHLDDPVDAIDRCARLLRARRRAVRRHARSRPR